MKRDLNLIKQILKYAECKGPGERGFLFHPEVAGCSDEEIEYHVRLCGDAGYVRINSTGHIIELTWDGHEALNDLRNNRSALKTGS